MEDVYKARCADLERQIVQLKLELAEAKVRTCASSFYRMLVVMLHECWVALTNWLLSEATSYSIVIIDS